MAVVAVCSLRLRGNRQGGSRGIGRVTGNMPLQEGAEGEEEVSACAVVQCGRRDRAKQ